MSIIVSQRYASLFDFDRIILDENELADYLPALRILTAIFTLGSTFGLALLGYWGLLTVPIWAALLLPGAFQIYAMAAWPQTAAQTRSYYLRLVWFCSLESLVYVAITPEPVGTIMAFLQPIYVAEALFFATPRAGLQVYLAGLAGLMGIRILQTWLGIGVLATFPTNVAAMGGTLFFISLCCGIVWLLAYLVWQQKNRTSVTNIVLEQAYHELRVLERSRGDFLASITHELKTPLVTVRGYIDLALRGNLDVSAQKGLGVAKRSALRLQRLIDELLISADPKKMVLQLNMEHVSIHDVLWEEIANFANQAASQRVTMVHIGEGDEATVWADRERTGQVVSNLIGNALRFSPADSVIEVGARNLSPTEILVWVSDRGPGIELEKIQHLFEEHYTRDLAAASTQGMGLGLIICKRLVTAMGGRISLESEPGAGSTFSVTFSTRNQEKTPELPVARKRRAMVLDDESDVLSLIDYHLKAADFETALFRNGTAALERALQEDFDLFLLDVNVPGLTGVEVSRRLRAAGRGGRILLFSALIRNDAERLIGEAKADGFLPKPFDFEQIAEVLNTTRAVAGSGEPV